MQHTYSMRHAAHEARSTCRARSSRAYVHPQACMRCHCTACAATLPTGRTNVLLTGTHGLGAHCHAADMQRTWRVAICAANTCCPAAVGQLPFSCHNCTNLCGGYIQPTTKLICLQGSHLQTLADHAQEAACMAPSSQACGYWQTLPAQTHAVAQCALQGCRPVVKAKLTV
jgi:hypothetical protein